MDIAPKFAQCLKQKRRELSLTQRALGERIGYSEKAISKWESGAALPPAAVLLALSDALCVSVDELLCHIGEPQYFLGIDGGATKTDFWLADASGEVVSRVCLGSSNPADIGIDAVCERLEEGVRQVLGGVSPRLVSVYAGLSGGSVGNYAQTVCTHLERFRFARIGCGNDAGNIIAAGLGARDGVSVIMGTGSVVYIQKNGERSRLGGYGYLFDEGGNGYAIGRDAISAALRAEEGSAADTLLCSLIKERTGKDTVLGALSVFYEGGKREIASYAPLVIEAYEKGDRVAADILDRNMACMAELLCLARKKLGGEPPVRVVMVGGLTRRADILLPMLARHLDAPEHYDIRVYEQPAVWGALLLAGLKRQEGDEV